MKEINEEVATDIENILEYLGMVHVHHPADVINSMRRVESFLATFTPNHFDEKDISH